MPRIIYFSGRRFCVLSENKAGISFLDVRSPDAPNITSARFLGFSIQNIDVDKFFNNIILLKNYNLTIFTINCFPLTGIIDYTLTYPGNQVLSGMSNWN
jgi:hypothetical protein